MLQMYSSLSTYSVYVKYLTDGEFSHKVETPRHQNCNSHGRLGAQRTAGKRWLSYCLFFDATIKVTIKTHLGQYQSVITIRRDYLRSAIVVPYTNHLRLLLNKLSTIFVSVACNNVCAIRTFANAKKTA